MKILEVKAHTVVNLVGLFCLVSLGSAHWQGGALVTCGSVLKLLNTHYPVRLHSHDIKYATGSEQQSVTGTESQEDVNSHWVVQGAKTRCFRGERVKCKGVIRLTHLETGMNLRSHHFLSPLSRDQEISADRSARSDTGDHWAVLCDGEYWARGEEVRLKHVDTDVYLSVSGNKYGSPIRGQYEIVGVRWPGDQVHWKAAEGLFVHPPEPVKKKFQVEHSEL